MKRPNWAAWTLVIVTAALGLGAIEAARIGLRTLRERWPPPFFRDCSTPPPHQAFAEVVGRPMPPGVADIQGAGCPQAGYVWMRLRATDAAIKSLTGGRKPDACKIGEGLASLLKWPDPRRVHWEEALLIRQPEYYVIRFGPSAVDTLDVVVDRQRHLVYLERYFQ
jgi:hypothetical protein